MSKTTQRKRYFVDLFAGCGGLSLGLEQAGWHPVFVNELNADAMATYIQNRPSHKQTLEKRNCNDIKDLVRGNGQQLDALADSLKEQERINVRKGELDLVVGGPPCQGYSGIGHRRSYSVHKSQLPSNHLFQDMAFVVKRLKPRLFLFENVRGLLTSRWTSQGEKGEIWRDVRQAFHDIGDYAIFWSLVYAKTYGVPQNRPRVLMVGVRKDLGVPVHGSEEDAVRAGVLPEGGAQFPHPVELLGDLEDRRFKHGGSTAAYPHEALSEIQEQLRQSRSGRAVSRRGDPVTEQDYSNHSQQIIRKFQYMLDNGGEIPKSMQTKKFAQRVIPKKWGPTGPSITATSLSDDYVHFSQPRNLTVREWARLQMFPDWYQFAGKRTTGGIRRAGNPQLGIFDRELPKYTQIGNAVPVGLAKAVGQHLRRLIAEK